MEKNLIKKIEKIKSNLENFLFKKISKGSFDLKNYYGETHIAAAFYLSKKFPKTILRIVNYYSKKNKEGVDVSWEFNNRALQHISTSDFPLVKELLIPLHFNMPFYRKVSKDRFYAGIP